MKWCVIFVLAVLFKAVDRVGGSCNLSLKQDFGNPAPVYLRNGDFVEPNADGAILLRRAETLQIACPGDRKFIVLNNDTTKLDVIDVKCVSDSTFRAAKLGWVGHLKEIRCNAPPWFTVEKTSAVCYGGNNIYRVGYKILNKFHLLYEACFDRGTLTTVYVKHRLSPTSYFGQVTHRPQFIEGDLFPQVRMSQLYKAEQQRSRLDTLLGRGMGEKYVTKNSFLNRGHLAAKADFSMAAMQRATFHYINAVPQWNRGNAGDWAALEEALRRRLKTYNSSVDVYTGTHGVMSLADQKLFLHTDENNNGVVPVPLYFYKVIYDPQKKLAAAFISINSPYYNASTNDALSYCDDICPRFSWLRWRANDATHSFCCAYSDHSAVVRALPPLDVKGLFY
ncbi:salivary endonuclease-like [Epargyreus clarus]|uniref:salivary endonuclease-like n=1 Tax=Epargyreus clarus TaxID=520877 RepID=UPI003C30B0E5